MPSKSDEEAQLWYFRWERDEFPMFCQNLFGQPKEVLAYELSLARSWRDWTKMALAGRLEKPEKFGGIPHAKSMLRRFEKEITAIFHEIKARGHNVDLINIISMSEKGLILDLHAWEIQMGAGGPDEETWINENHRVSMASCREYADSWGIPYIDEDFLDSFREKILNPNKISE